MFFDLEDAINLLTGKFRCECVSPNLGITKGSKPNGDLSLIPAHSLTVKSSKWLNVGWLYDFLIGASVLPVSVTLYLLKSVAEL